jgi:hypothetical protein
VVTGRWHAARWDGRLGGQEMDPSHVDGRRVKMIQAEDGGRRKPRDGEGGRACHRDLTVALSAATEGGGLELGG